MALTLTGAGSTLSSTPNTVVYTVPTNASDATVLEIQAVARLASKLNVQIGRRGTLLVKDLDFAANKSQVFSMRTVLMPGESIQAWADLENALDLNLSVAVRTK